MIARDGGKWCLICGISRSGLHLHRVVYGSQGGIYEVDNCVLLCDRDHTMVHSNKRIWQPALQEYLQTLDPYEIRSLRDTA
ncbi:MULTISPECIES: HNH endonuclease [unclassified Paenibacillus]|uniref:HNH endonuclease n=1 Tax=Paenibacillus provencensis TaxID=441151 RepID=A0ABW3PS34_9BACL|nr:MULTISPECIES: HNH endonuclease [unclassified Paenibacillus]